MKNKILAIGMIFMFLLSFIVCIDNSIANPNSITFDFNLYSGWNLITIPVENVFTASTLVASIDGINIVSRWNSELQRLESYIENISNPMNDFDIINGKGYYVNVESNTQFSVTGLELSGVIVDLVEGFNLLGWYESSSTTASSIFNSITGCINVTVFDPITQLYKNYRSSSDQDFVISQGMGYWVELDYNFQIDFYSGYNLITIPVENDYTASTLGSAIPGCQYISEFNHETQMYKSYIFGFSGPESDFTIKDGIGYYVIVDSDVSVVVKGIPLIDVSVSVYDGANHLGWYDNKDTTASAVMNSNENCIKVSKYDAVNQVQIDYESTSDQDFTISRGMGYIVWIETSAKPNSLSIDVPDSVNEEEDFLVIISSEDNRIKNAVVTFNGMSYLTDSSGAVSLRAPSVNKDTSFSITATKTDYQSSVKSIIVKDKITNIQILSPNGDEVLSNTYPILWSIRDEPLNPYAVTIQYQYKGGSWINIIENFNGENNLYLWDTINLPDGYPYLIKVILKEDKNKNGIYEAINEDTSDKPFAIDNSITKLGIIFGTIMEEINKTFLPVENAKVYVIISNENNVITSKCTYTDENGKYEISLSRGIFSLEISKDGYLTNVTEEIVIWANVSNEINIILERGIEIQPGRFPIFRTENSELIQKGIKNRKVGGEVTIKLDENLIDYKQYIFIYNDITITPNIVKKGSISLIIDGDENSSGRVLVLNLGPEIFGPDENLIIEYDGEKIKLADDIIDVLNPNDDGSHPEYLITYGANGTQIIISIPHFSQHHISILSDMYQEIIKEAMRYKEIAIASAIGIIAIAAIVMFRKGKDD
jgi:hypothetical protein